MRYQHFGLAYPRNPVQLHGKRDTKCTQEELLFWIWNGLMAERNVLVISNGIHDRKSPTRVLLTAALGNVTICSAVTSSAVMENWSSSIDNMTRLAQKIAQQ